MNRSSLTILLILLLIPVLVLANTIPAKRPLPTPRLLTGDERPNGQVVYPPYRPLETDGLDLIGDTVTVGTTWYDYQHNGQIGRMIALDLDGKAHLVWTNGLDQPIAERHVYYNTVDSLLTQGWPYTGTQVETATNGGYTCLVVNEEGRAFVAFHQQTAASPNKHSAVAVDYIPGSGVFLAYEIPWQGGEDLAFIWPRIARKPDGQMLVLSHVNPGNDQNWTWGTYDPATFTISYTDPVLAEPSSSIGNEVGASRVSNRVGAAYPATVVTTFPNAGSDLHAMVDDDGLNLDFASWWNVTNFFPPDEAFYPDTSLMDGDTLRVYCDDCVFFDQNDVCHITFTTVSYFSLEGGVSYWNSSFIWTWCETWPDEFRLVANAWDPSNYVDCGGWNFRAQRPSMGQDPTTGYLYCMYQYFDVDTTHLSQFPGSSGFGMPSGEVCISVSTDGGYNWSVGTNVTNTVTHNYAPPGECLSETFPSMAEVVNGTCHLTYVMDYDAGSYLQTEGTQTFNSVKYHRVPAEAIEPMPLVEQNVPFHVSHMGPWASAPHSGEALPTSISLEQNVPNPFNPTTTIRFSLNALSDVVLSVYNLKGELVTQLARGVFAAGTHTLGFDGSQLATGVYLYRLEAGGTVLQKKMVLVK